MSFLANEIQGEEHQALVEAGFGVSMKYKKEFNSTNTLKNILLLH